MPPKQNERREVRTFTKKQSKRCPDHLNQEPRRKRRGPASFCVCALPVYRVRCARLWMTSSCEMLLPLEQTLLFFYLLLLLFAITTTGAPHTLSFYTGVETTWGFPPTGRKIKIIELLRLQSRSGFYYCNATDAHRLRDSPPLKCWSFLMWWNNSIICRTTHRRS